MMHETDNYRYVGDLDLSKVHCMPIATNANNNSKSAKLFADALSVQKNNMVKFSLCPNLDDARFATVGPVTTRYGLDLVRQEQNDKTKRGLVVRLSDPVAIAQCKAFDDAIVKMAVEQSQQWFKRTLNEDQVRALYNPLLVEPVAEPEGTYYLKFKVKTSEAVVPTEVYRPKAPGSREIVRLTESLLESPGAKIIPHLSAYAVWFMSGTKFGVSFQAEKLMVVGAPPARTSLHDFGASLTLVANEEEEAGGDAPSADLKVELVGGEGGPLKRGGSPDERDGAPAKRAKTDDEEGGAFGAE